MPPKRGRPFTSANGKAPLQSVSAAATAAHHVIKKPLELIGDGINVPGAFWEGRMSAAEKETR